MIRTISGDFESDSPSQRRPWTWGDELVEAQRDPNDAATMIIQLDHRGGVKVDEALT